MACMQVGSAAQHDSLEMGEVNGDASMLSDDEQVTDCVENDWVMSSVFCACRYDVADYSFHCT